MYQIGCRAREEVLGRGNEHGMLLDQQFKKGNIRWESCREGIDSR